MDSNTRSKNTIRNSKFGLLLKLVSIVGAFLARTVLIRVLGVEYAGLDGLFTSILTFLNMAESGFSTAVVYKLYKPVAENDTKKVCALLNYYKYIYRWIGGIVFAVGIVLIPFLGYFIKGDVPDQVNITSLYLIYLANTCFSYWLFAYKTALLNACQRNDRISKVTGIILSVKYLLQVILVLLFKNYYVFAIIIPATTILTNIGMELVTRKHYPDYICKGDVDKDDKKEIKKKVSALLFNKIGTSIINGSDNIVISAFLGLGILGIYNSYYYIFHMLYGIFAVFHSAVTASVGNSIILEDVKKNKLLFNRFIFLNSWAVGFCSISLVCLYTPFMKIWVGSDKVLDDKFALLMSIYFYLWMIRFVVIIFKSAQGLWWEDRYRAAIEGIFNLLLNIITVQYIGIYGVTISTVVAMIVVSIPWETKILFDKYFKEKAGGYYLFLIKNIIVTIVAGSITYIVTRIVCFGEVLQLIFNGFVCLIIPNVVYFVIYSRSDEFKWSLVFAKGQIR